MAQTNDQNGKLKAEISALRSEVDALRRQSGAFDLADIKTEQRNAILTMLASAALTGLALYVFAALGS